jgi:hypothetical protein
MSDNTKQKKAIRARQTETGESYSTARMHVIRSVPPPPEPTSGFRAVVEETIRLAEAVASPQPTGGAHDADRSLRDHLLRLPEADLRKVEVLMYAGRGEGAVLELARTLARDTHEMTVKVVTDKVRVLAEYLRAGLGVALEERIDLDAIWVRKPPGKWARAPGSDYDLAIDGMHVWDTRVPASREAHHESVLRRVWAEREGVTLTEDHACLLRLTEAGCRAPGRSCVHLPGCDHTSLWMKDGKPHIYVTQPYNLSIERLDEMFRACRRLGLTLRVDSALAWHDAGAVLIEVLRA